MSTKLTVKNSNKNDVKVWLTLGAVPGCEQSVHDIFGVTDYGLKGSFILKSNESRSYTPKDPKIGISGNICFVDPSNIIDVLPINCPNRRFPNGVNIFEWTINNSFQPGAPQESVDISCVTGVHCLMKVTLIGGSSWNAGPAGIVKEFHNAPLYQNTGLVGVYPYGCDDCTRIYNPPMCCYVTERPPYEKPQSAPICQVQRDAIFLSTGEIVVEFLSLL